VSSGEHVFSHDLSAWSGPFDSGDVDAVFLREPARFRRNPDVAGGSDGQWITLRAGRALSSDDRLLKRGGAGASCLNRRG